MPGTAGRAGRRPRASPRCSRPPKPRSASSSPWSARRRALPRRRAFPRRRDATEPFRRGGAIRRGRLGRTAVPDIADAHAYALAIAGHDLEPSIATATRSSSRRRGSAQGRPVSCAPGRRAHRPALARRSARKLELAALTPARRPPADRDGRLHSPHRLGQPIGSRRDDRAPSLPALTWIDGTWHEGNPPLMGARRPCDMAVLDRLRRRPRLSRMRARPRPALRARDPLGGDDRAEAEDLRGGDRPPGLGRHRAPAARDSNSMSARCSTRPMAGSRPIPRPRVSR